MIDVIPTIIPEKFSEIEEKISLVKSLAKKVQIDFVDGKYGSVTTWPFNTDKKENLPYKDEVILEADMMIQNPEYHIRDFADIGIKSFVIHIDSTDVLEQCVTFVKNAGGQVGLGVKPSLALPYDNVLEKFDFIQFMGNDKVGFGGVELDRRVIKKIADFRATHPFIPIQIDIGVNWKTAVELKQAGVTAFVSGSTVFGSTSSPRVAKDVAKNIEKLKNI